MKRVFSRITATILSVAVGACAPQSETSQETGNIRVLAPQSDFKAGYSLQTVELQGIEDLQTVSGKYVRFVTSPRVSKDTLRGRPAVARFIKNKEGEFIPANELTQQLVTIYAHTQRLAQLDEELGAGGVNTWPRDVGIGVRVKGGMSNNAFYDGTTDSMLVVPYTNEGLPIAINGGILAHEHFHSLFYKIVMKDLDQSVAQSLHDRGEFLEQSGIVQEELNSRERKSLPAISGAELPENNMAKAYRLAMVRGLNEGLADFWGWMYTGDPDFIAQSLPREKMTRSLESDPLFPQLKLPTATEIRRNLEVFYSAGERARFREYVTGYSYSLGTRFSRVLKAFTEVVAQERELDNLVARKQVAKVIVKLLPTLRADLAAKAEGFYLSEQFVLSFAATAGELKQKECEFLAEVLEASTDNNNIEYLCKEGSGWALAAVEKSAKEKSEGVSE